MSGAEESQETPEERLAFLRQHGVVVETPEDRAASKGKTTIDGNGREAITFSYVRIPSDESKPYELLKAEGFVAEDCMHTLLKSAFAGGSIDESTAKKTALAQMGNSVTEKGLGVLGDAAAGGVVETFALVRPSKTNGYCGVYIYLDEVGMLKKLPSNPRARALAATCGFHGADFFGDVFVGRTRVQPSPMRNVDFALEDMDSSADWIKRAGAENYDYGLGMREFKDVVNKSNPGGAPDVDPDAEKDGDGYKWSQTDSDVEITIDCGQNVKKSDIKITFKADSLKVVVADGGRRRGEDGHWAVRKREAQRVFLDHFEGELVDDTGKNR
eukprot:CAMPEP_0206257150 /NCGR_PEP_ID=MMETSP0047_2-20121206/25175_1 /ASSEMBLY_ACC=CAM_ASM_000192 /TAXON_ID=195065 /ORGANISM="Chroomonas mesostigmatica_cf, Strain CCMP1168" /LENGTH=327 /DNA_ID=CAMNT_0053683693 /DNA_START=179 /DNA_END=1162 /DNA_ORIENTATION=+